MAVIEIVREVPLSPDQVWQRVTSWPNHGRAVPFTTVRLTPNGFVARTGVGPLAFDDPMEIVEHDPPRRCRIVKRGRVVVGEAEILVAPQGPGSRLTWRESVHVRGVPGFLGRLEAWASRRLFSRVVDDLLA